MLKKLMPNTPLAERAYRELKRAIVQNRFLPGDPLPEEMIASMLGVSRTPLRKAISRLSFEGLVELEPGKIARVARFTREDLENFIKLREVLEVFAAEQAVPHVTDDFLEELESNWHMQKETVEQKDYYEYIECDAQFHILIAKCSQNPKLTDYIEQLNTQLHRYLILSGTLGTSDRLALAEHREILEALRKRDVAAVRDAMRKHILSVEGRAKSSLQNGTKGENQNVSTNQNPF